MALEFFYHSSVVIALWAVTTVFAMWYLLLKRRRLSLAAFTLHCSFVVILIGAAITHFFGEQGTIKLMADDAPIHEFRLNEGGTSQFPFAVKMNSTEISYYSATDTPMNYATNLEFHDGGKVERSCVSMNHVAVYQGYRFYQTALGHGYSVLSVCYDPWGIGVTYAGYALLFLSSIAFLFTRRSRFRAISLIGLMLFCVNVNAQQVLQRPLAKSYGSLLVYWNNRVSPLQTMARDFCQKIYGSTSYKGFTAEQVLTGWIFYYDDWKNEPFIKVKDAELQKRLGVTGKYATLHDFYGAGTYKLEAMFYDDELSKAAQQADEKVNLIAQVCTGRAMKIFPMLDADGCVEWLSWTDRCALDTDADEALFVQTTMDHVARNIMHGRYNTANDIIHEIGAFQRRAEVDAMLPSSTVISAERLYNKANHTLIAAICAIIFGVVACLGFVRQKVVNCVTVMLLAYVTFVIALRWIIGGHLPLSNGYETMQALAWIALAIGVCLQRIPIITAMGTIVAGLALMVSVMGESNPTVSYLIPVLASPLLSVHVMLIMISYALFTIMMLNALVAFVQPDRAYRLANVSIVLLYPAVLTLAAGIFVGAIWANQSWGRYWGWDPKETWALITLIVYALPLHVESFNCFAKPRFLHCYNVVAFLVVLMTYFGVNYLLSGMHSYATA